ncbi:cytochrome P450 3A12-like [Serinus canaria]|uniref:cytochrome P450 3A12-like n=1 Tax=Serinus canaria TaxID=9135 RepID=UPI0021CCC607|nr:cytochrome P450 3A12-like [Serinus canaria]
MQLLPSLSPVTWLLLVSLLCLVALCGIWPYQTFKKLGIPGPQPLPFVGTFLEYRHGVHNFDQKCFEKYEKIWGFYDGRQPVLAVLDPILIKNILVKECYSIFTNRQNFHLNGILGSALNVAEDEQWKGIRMVLSPTFTSGKLKEGGSQEKGVGDETAHEALHTEALGPMACLEMVMNESIRLHPAGGRLKRVCKKTVELNGVTIAEGMVVLIPAFVLHRDPQYWPEPDEFRPERFSKENKEGIDPYTFLPFGAGPRNCIGMRFAHLVVKVAVVVLLQNFSFRPCKDTPIPLVLDSKGFMQPKKPIVLKMVPRAQADPKN